MPELCYGGGWAASRGLLWALRWDSRVGPPLTSGHPLFLQDLGMESTSLDDVLYRYASFRNLVDPITHDLIISLARYIHCPKPVGRLWSKLARSGGVRWAPFWAEQFSAQRGLVDTTQTQGERTPCAGTKRAVGLRCPSVLRPSIRG